MTTPVRIQRKRAKGFDLQAASRAVNGLECVVVDRSSGFGSPFSVSKCWEHQVNGDRRPLWSVGTWTGPALWFRETRAEAASPDKAVLVIVTDGNENDSREMTKDSAKAALDRARGRNWQVIFLAAEFDNFAQASGLGNAAAQTINTAAGSRVATMASTARMTAAYAASGRAMLYGDDDYKTASGSGR